MNEREVGESSDAETKHFSLGRKWKIRKAKIILRKNGK